MAKSDLTISVAASDRSLLSIAEMRTAAGVPDASQDAFLATLADMTDDALARVCGLAEAPPTPPTFRVETMTEVMRDCSRAPHLLLARRPVVSVASVTIDGTELDAAEYEVIAETGFLYRLSSDARIVWTFDKATIVYQAGWATVPPALKLAAMKTLRTFWHENGPDGHDPNLKRTRIEGVGEREYWVSPASDPLLSREITELLAPFREGLI